MKADAKHFGTADADPLEQHPAYLLKRLQHSVRQSVDEALRRANVGASFAHIVLLFGIRRDPGISGAQLAKRSMVTAQTMNALLRRLERDGSVVRRRHPQNRRIDCWYVTPAGLKQLRRARAAAQPVWDRLFAAFDAQELTQFCEFLRRSIEAVDREAGGAGFDARAVCGPVRTQTPRSRR